MEELRTAVVIFVALTAACNSSVIQRLDEHKSAKAQDPETLCRRVAEIKSIPFKDERVDDEAYNALIDAGEEVVPCLINKVADDTPMRDPRSIPGPTDTRVGDVAFFVLIDITKLDFESMMPPEVKSAFKEQGILCLSQVRRRGSKPQAIAIKFKSVVSPEEGSSAAPAKSYQVTAL